jgi:RNA recognition motif-containing protein
MGGIGTFSRANRTLYVGRINTKSQKMLAEQFGEFGTIESIKVLEDKGCAFVKYSLRAAAEFAKEAMDSQAEILLSPKKSDLRSDFTASHSMTDRRVRDSLGVSFILGLGVQFKL